MNRFSGSRRTSYHSNFTQPSHTKPVQPVSQTQPQRLVRKPKASELKTTVPKMTNRAILAQSYQPPNYRPQAKKPFANLISKVQKVFATIVRLSLLGVLIAALWWVWPQSGPIDLEAMSNESSLSRDLGNRIAGASSVQSLQEIAIGQGIDSPAASFGRNVSVQPVILVTPVAVMQLQAVSSKLLSEGEGETQQEGLLPATSATMVDTAPLAPNQLTDGNDEVISDEALSIIEKSAQELIEATDLSMPSIEEEPQLEYPVSIPTVRIITPVSANALLTPEATPTPAPQATATPRPIVGIGRLWSTFTPPASDVNDHFWVGRPFTFNAPTQIASPSYQFGSTAGNRYRPHHGLDIANPNGMAVLAATTGEVVHAGPDDQVLLGPYNNFYGNTVVIRLDKRLPVAGGELDVYVLYGHLSAVSVAVGQQVQPEEVIGNVGMTGIAIGPHLHVEARLGANTYQHSVNPYLWMQPLEGSGAVAVRILTASGQTWSGARVTIGRFLNGQSVWARQIETYLDTENIGPDPAWGENGAMGSVPAGYYYLIGNINGERIRTEFTVVAGQTTFIEVRTQQ